MTGGEPRIAILGAGPVGLEAALAAAEKGYRFTVYEAAESVAGNVRAWGHVRLFTPWSMNLSPRMRRHLADGGIRVPEGASLPTGDELVEKALEPLAHLPEIVESLRLGTRVRAVGRQGMVKSDAIGSPERARRPFRLLLEDVRGSQRIERADVVVDSTGTYGNPNHLGDGGIPAPGEERLEDRIVRGIPDLSARREEWKEREVLLVGAGHSAQTVARDFAEEMRGDDGARMIWAVRSEDPEWGAVPDDPLPERARLTERAGELARGASPRVEVVRGVTVDALEERNGKVGVTLRKRGEGGQEVEVDRIVGLTGSVGDHRIYRELQVHECYATAGPMKLSAALLGAGEQDCLDQTSQGAETLVNPEPGFFIVGEKSYGRNKNFLMRVGWEQVEEVFSLLGNG